MSLDWAFEIDDRVSDPLKAIDKSLKAFGGGMKTVDKTVKQLEKTLALESVKGEKDPLKKKLALVRLYQQETKQSQEAVAQAFKKVELAVVAVVALCLTQVIFAIGESMLQPAGSAIINHIAPEHLRGRYNSAAGTAWGFSNTLAPAITGLYYALHIGNWWPLGTGITALIGGLLVLRLRSALTPEEDGVSSPAA